jgi:hypothetical protein
MYILSRWLVTTSRLHDPRAVHGKEPEVPLVHGGVILHKRVGG